MDVAVHWRSTPECWRGLRYMQVSPYCRFESCPHPKIFEITEKDSIKRKENRMCDTKNRFLSITNIHELKVCVLQAEELNIDDKHVKDISDDVFLELAKEKEAVYTLQEFVHKFNLEQIIVSSENSYLRIIECNK